MLLTLLYWAIAVYLLSHVVQFDVRLAGRRLRNFREPSAASRARRARGCGCAGTRPKTGETSATALPLAS